MAVTKTAAGKRDKFITIKALVETQDAEEFPVENWDTTLCTSWASKEAVDTPARLAERFEANQTAARMWTVWGIPYRADMDPDAVDVQKTRKIEYLGRSYDIVDAVLIDRLSIRLVTIVSSKVAA